MIDSVSAGRAAYSNDPTETKVPAATNAVNKETFMQLLVAQIKNQNPLDPTDGVQFLSQLAQFSELEQMMGIRSEVEGLRKDMAPEQTTETGDGTAAGENPAAETTSGAGNV